MQKVKEKQYEIAYHLSGTLDPSELAGAVDRIRTTVEKNGGTIVEEQGPKQFNLVYPIRYHVGGGYETYETSQFGFMCVQVDRGATKAIEQALQADDAVLRLLISVHEHVQPERKPRTKSVLQKSDKKEKKESVKEQSELSDEEMDKEIEKLVISE